VNLDLVVKRTGILFSVVLIFFVWNEKKEVAVSIPALASVSVLQSAAVGGSVVGVVGPL